MMLSSFIFNLYYFIWLLRYVIEEKINYHESSSVLKLGLDDFFPFFLVLFLYNFIIKVHKFGRPGPWHSPSVRGISSLINRLTVSPVIGSNSIGVIDSDDFILVILLFFIDAAHPMNPINSVFLFSFAHSIFISCFIAFDFLACLKSLLLELFNFCFEFLILEFQLMKFIWIIVRAIFLFI